MPNVELVKKDRLSPFRRVAIGTWRTAYDPSVYGKLALRADKCIAYIEEFRARTGRKLTFTHLMAKAAGLVLAEIPDANAILRFNRIYLRKEIGVFFQVAMEDKKTGEIDLSGIVVKDPHKKSMIEILDEVEKRAGTVKAGTDTELEGTRRMFERVPFLLLNKFLELLSFLGYTLNIDMRTFGAPRDPFGSIMITNVGALGLEEAFAPLVPYSRVPLLIAVPSVRQEMVVEDGKPVVGHVLNVCATFDHRVLDGSHAARMTKTIRRIFDDPEAAFGPLPVPATLVTTTTTTG